MVMGHKTMRKATLNFSTQNCWYLENTRMPCLTKHIRLGSSYYLTAQVRISARQPLSPYMGYWAG